MRELFTRLGTGLGAAVLTAVVIGSPEPSKLGFILVFLAILVLAIGIASLTAEYVVSRLMHEGLVGLPKLSEAVVVTTATSEAEKQGLGNTHPTAGQ